MHLKLENWTFLELENPYGDMIYEKSTKDGYMRISIHSSQFKNLPLYVCFNVQLDHHPYRFNCAINETNIKPIESLLPKKT